MTTWADVAAQLEAKEDAHRRKEEIDRERRAARREEQAAEKRINERESAVDRRSNSLDQREQDLQRTEARLHIVCPGWWYCLGLLPGSGFVWGAGPLVVLNSDSVSRQDSLLGSCLCHRGALS